MLFQKPSLRTRVTFEAGMNQLGGHAIYLTEDVVMGARESVRDVARNLERFVDAIVARTGPHEVVVELAAQASIPVINGLTLREHPCQALADLFTIRERFGDLHGRVLAFVGDGNNVYHSLALLGAMLGMEVRLAHPGRLRAEPADRRAGRGAGRRDRRPAGLRRATRAEVVRGADVVYTDAWTSMGQEAEAEARRDAFAAYRVDDALLDAAGPGRGRDALPAGPPRRGDHVGGDGRPAEHHLGPVREPAPRPEGAPRRGARGSEPGDDAKPGPGQGPGRRAATAARRDRPTRARPRSTSATRTPSGAATSRRCAAGTTPRSTPTARRPRSPPTGRCRTRASAGSS